MGTEEQQTRVGRPPHQPTEATKEQVAIAAGGGMSHSDIALALGIDKKTLEKWYEHELAHGAYAKRLEVLAAMHANALKGNVSAQKAYLALEPGLAAPPPPKADPVGKKEQQAKDAVVAHKGTDWEDDLRPRGATLN